MSNNQTYSRQNAARYQNNRYQNNRSQNNGNRNNRPQNHGSQNNGPRANANGLTVPPKFLLYAFAFVVVTSALLGGWIGQLLEGTNCW